MTSTDTEPKCLKVQRPKTRAVNCLAREWSIENNSYEYSYLTTTLHSLE